MTIIDAHIHFWQLARGDYTALTPAMPVLLKDHLPDDLAPLLAAAGVDGIVVVQAAETVAETHFTLGLARRYPWIRGIVGWAELADPGSLDALPHDPMLKGIRPVRDDNRSIGWLADEALTPGFRALAARGLSLDVLVQNPAELPIVTGIAERHPGLTIILDHCAKPDIAGRAFHPWAEDIAALARLPQVACKFSGLLNQAGAGWTVADLQPYADHVLQCFGPQRLIWASDWPPLRLAADYPVWWEVAHTLLAALGGADRAAVFGGNAERLYRLAG